MTNIIKKIKHFWLDHLEIYGIFKNESLFEKLDFDNSNYGEFDSYIIEKHEVPKFAYKITFKHDNYSLFAYYKWRPKSEKQPVATRDYITIYSTAFKLYEYEEILYFLEKNLNLSHPRRFDICMDLKIEIDELLSKYFDNINTWREYKKSWKTETRYYWEMKNSKNKRQLIRVYDKIRDIKEKKKIALYKDYLIENNVTRVELEIRPELAKVRQYLDIFDNTLLIWIFKNYLYKYSKIFETIPWERITLFKRKKIDINSEEYQSLYYKTQRKNVFIGHAKTIANFWFCPVRVLIWEWLIKPETVKLLWKKNIETIIDRELKAKAIAKDDMHFNKNLPDLLANYYKYGKM